MASTILGPLIGSLAPYVFEKLFGGKEGYSGSTKNVGNIQGYDYNQNPLFAQIQQLLQNSPNLQPQNPEQLNERFNTEIADPSNKYYQERIRPGIQSRFSDPNTTGGSALRNALNTGAEDLGTSLAGLRSNYFQNQNNNQYNSIAQALGLAQAQAGQSMPNIQTEKGFGDVLGPLLRDLDWGQLLQKVPGFGSSNQGMSQNNGQQMNWQVPGQLSGNSQGSNQNMGWGQ